MGSQKSKGIHPSEIQDDLFFNFFFQIDVIQCFNLGDGANFSGISILVTLLLNEQSPDDNQLKEVNIAVLSMWISSPHEMNEICQCFMGSVISVHSL